MDSFLELKEKLKELAEKQKSLKDAPLSEVLKALRPKGTHTHIYLYPYIKFAHGEDIALAFNKLKPTNAWLENDHVFLLLPRYITSYLPETGEKDDVCAFTILRNSPHFIDYGYGITSGESYTILVFKYENEKALECFLESSFSKMYPDWLPNFKKYFCGRNGIGIYQESFLWSVCMRTEMKVHHVAKIFGVAPELITECDTKINIAQELWKNSIYANNTLFSSSSKLQKPC